MCSIEGWSSISGITNEKFEVQNPVVLEFSNVDNAHYFKGCVEYYFDENILEALKLKKTCLQKWHVTRLDNMDQNNHREKRLAAFILPSYWQCCPRWQSFIRS